MAFRISLHKDVLSGNQEWAERNLYLFNTNHIFTINFMSSPGAGKTSLLESVIPQLKKHARLAVIEGDLCTTLDAERIAQLGVKTVQINTQGACHLDARMINDAILRIPLTQIDLLIIENVGNLVCPADFYLGEHVRMTVLSVTEGADKAEKYPFVFRSADAILLNKIDLLPYVSFDVGRFRVVMSEMNPSAPIFPMSATSREGLTPWTDWILQTMRDRMEQSE